MKKIITIAIREYRAMVGTKAFLISIIMMPILMLGGVIAMDLLKNVGNTKERAIAIIDHSNEFYDQIVERVEVRNRMIRRMASRDFDQSKSPTADDSADVRIGTAEAGIPGMAPEIYRLKKIEASSVTDEVRLQLSEQVRTQDLYAFVEIPADVLKTDVTANNDLKFYSQDSSLSLARNWIADVVSNIARKKRIAATGIPASDVRKVRQASARVNVIGLGLMSKSTDGEIISGDGQDPMTAIFLPMGVMMLMFMVIFMASQPMLESVIEEKSQRIAEVLLGSANPFQLMMGKLLGTVAGSLTIFGIYAVGTYLLASSRGLTDMIPLFIVPWFILFQIVGVLFYASIFMAVGASVSQLKEAQTMLLPVWMLMMSPLFIWFLIVRDPLGPIAQGFSFFPPATPTAMVLRMATGQTIPIWQPIVGLIVTLISTLVIVVFAARIFRIGILWQGKTPKLSEILKWAITGN